MPKARLRDLGITLGQLPAGPLNAITDVAGVAVGVSTIIRDQPHVARSGVTAIWPSQTVFSDFLPAGFHSFNGNGEMTGTIWLAEQGLIASPICITNTHAVGVVRDAIVELAAKRKIEMAWHLPVTAETWDGWLSDAENFPVTSADAIAALEGAKAADIGAAVLLARHVDDLDCLIDHGERDARPEQRAAAHHAEERVRCGEKQQRAHRVPQVLDPGLRPGVELEPDKVDVHAIDRRQRGEQQQQHGRDVGQGFGIKMHVCVHMHIICVHENARVKQESCRLAG